MPRRMKKDFDKDKMYSKIMPSIVTPLSSRDEEGEAPGLEEREAPKKEEARAQAPRQTQQKYILRNFIEDIVMDKLERTITMLRCCECERCKKEVMAYALNMLPTAYAVLPPDTLEATVKQLRQTHEVKVSSALIKAVQTVKSNPSHD